MSRILVAIATYNEIENLPRLVDQLAKLEVALDILVVDDNSPDGTGKWCDSAKSEYASLSCIHRTGKLGLGTAAVAAFHWAIENEYDMIATMDGDLSHDPQDIPGMIELAVTQSADVIVGSRYISGGGIEGWPWYRRLASRMLNGYARFLLRLRPRDTSGAFRVYQVKSLAKLDLSAMRSVGYVYLEEILWRLQRAGNCVVEYPIMFTNRAHGESKINSAEAINAVLMITRLGIFKK